MLKPLDIIDILNDLPDDIVESANHHRQHHYHKNIKYRYIISTIAACLVGVICLKIYPRPDISAPKSKFVTNESLVTDNDTAPFTDTQTDEGISALVTAPDDTTIASEASVTSAINDFQNSDITKATSGALSYNTSDEYSTDNSNVSEMTTDDEVNTVIETTASYSEAALPSDTTEPCTIPAVTSSPCIPVIETPTITTDVSPVSTSYTLEKSSCPLPEQISGTQIDPVTKQPIPVTAQVDFDGEMWSITLAESCVDAGILSGTVVDDVLYLSVICLNNAADITDETICFSLFFSDEINADIAEIYVDRRDIDDEEEFHQLYTDTPIIQYETC